MSTEIEVNKSINVLLYDFLTSNAKFLLSFLKLKLYCRFDFYLKLLLTV